MIKRILLIVLSIVTVLLVTLYFSYDYWLEKELKYRLSEIISKDPNSMYRYSFDKLNIDLIDGSVHLKGIKIEPRDRGYDSLSSETSPVRFLLHLELDQIELLEFEIMEFIGSKRIVVEAVKMHQPSFVYYFNPKKKKSVKQTMPLSEVFSEKFQSADIKIVSITDGSIVIDNYQSSAAALKINYIDIDFIEANMDIETLKQVIPVNYTDIKLVAASISADISPNFSIVSDSLLFDAQDESFTIREFQIKPKYDMENWAKMHEVQKQWFGLTLGSLSIRHIDLEHFVHTGELLVGRIRVRKPNVSLYKDKSKPEPPFVKKPLPATLISSIPLKMKVDSVEIIDGYLAIQETSKLTGMDSHISFNDLNGKLTNFTNLPEEERNSNNMELHASSRMYNKAPVKVTMKFDLSSKIDQFEAFGTVDSVDMTTFNPVLEPMMGVLVTGGKLHSASFHFNAMDTLSTGIMDMEYDNAKIEVLNSDTTATKHKKGFLSFAANTIIKSNNNMSKASYKQGVIKTERVLNKDVWPYLWHSIQSGIVSTIAPITNDKETKHQQKQRKHELKQERKGGKN